MPTFKKKKKCQSNNVTSHNDLFLSTQLNGLTHLPFISFKFIALSAFDASGTFLNRTNANPRIFPSMKKHKNQPHNESIHSKVWQYFNMLTYVYIC